MFNVIPRDTKFFDLFEKAAEVIIKTADAYQALANNYDRREDLVHQIRQFEHAGDEVTHLTLDRLNTTFITPFDREDIQQLIRQMDDVIDEIDAAAKRMVLYRIEAPTRWFIKQADVLVRAAALIGEAIPRLRNLKKPGPFQDHLIEIHRLENMGDDNNHAAVADLYNHEKDPILVMKWKEIYDITERAIDTCEDIANTMESIVLKNS